ncbi:MAG: hypothetical protein ACOYKO_00885 [Rhodoluna sp.]
MKKLVFPGIMALVGVLATLLVFTNVTAQTSTELASLRVGDGTTFTELEPGATYELPTGTLDIMVEAKAVDPEAEITIEGNTGFVPGDNEVRIIVKGSDGKSTTVYKLNMVKPELSGWCDENSAKIKLYNDDFELADIYQDIELAYLDERLPEIKANLSCFSQLLQDYVNANE